MREMYWIMNKQVVVVGAGFSGMAAATSLADLGYQVTLVERHEQAGGRARLWKTSGFTFDMGPSWYWMPDIFERYFERFGKKVSDYYTLKRLDPSYKVVFPGHEEWDIPASVEELATMLEQYEPGAGKALHQFLKEAAYKYQVGIHDLVYKPGLSIMEFASFQLMKDVFKLDVFTSMSNHLRKFFKDSRILQLMEFPVLFLGAVPEKTPALYSLMNYADIALGTWYPEGGMHEIVKGMQRLAEEKGVKFQFNTTVNEIQVEQGKTIGLTTSQGFIPADIVVSGADYHHTETQWLKPIHRNYNETYWESRVMAPSSLIFYLGIEGEMKRLLHHNLFFDADFKLHAQEIYTDPAWPTMPLFYASCPSKTDPTVAPEGHENMFLLMPVAPGLSNDDEQTRERYYHMMMDRLEAFCGHEVRSKVVVKRSYAHRDFINDYGAFKGNAYGLANTLTQTAILKPSLKNKNVSNLYYTGQLTVPGPGVPPSLISGQVVAELIAKEHPHTQLISV